MMDGKGGNWQKSLLPNFGAISRRHAVARSDGGATTLWNGWPCSHSRTTDDHNFSYQHTRASYKNAAGVFVFFFTSFRLGSCLVELCQRFIALKFNTCICIMYDGHALYISAVHVFHIYHIFHARLGTRKISTQSEWLRLMGKTIVFYMAPAKCIGWTCVELIVCDGRRTMCARVIWICWIWKIYDHGPLITFASR